MTRLSVLAPAKLNLGLEVLRKRPDGFHEIRTVMQTIALYDRISIDLDDPDFRVVFPDGATAFPDNIVPRAARLLAERSEIEPRGVLTLEKRIPAAAGLGGASSDAAATLRLCAEAWEIPSETVHLAEIAAELGSDVPFFLSGGTAFVHGRGEIVESIDPLPPGFVVVAVPAIHIERKTPTLYRSLTPSDFSDGTRIDRLVSNLVGREAIAPPMLANAFSRPLLDIAPGIKRIQHAFRVADAPFIALSGAGPAHYTIVHDRKTADTLAATIRANLSDDTFIDICDTIQTLPAMIRATTPVGA